MKKPTLILLILVVSILIGGIFVYLKYFPKQEKPNLTPQGTQPPTAEPKTFESSTLDFTVQLPEEYEVEQGITFVDFNKGVNSMGAGRAAHAFNSLSEFIVDIDEKNKTKDVEEIRELEINGYPSRIRNELRGGVKVRMYYIFTNDWVYVFSTEAESLYSDLDQIAQSFRYTP